MSLLESALDKVKQAIDKYQPAEIEYDLKDKASVEKALDILEEEYNQIEEIHGAVHKMRSRFRLMWVVVDSEQGERRQFGKIKIKSTVDFRELKKKLPRVSGDAFGKREHLAINVAEAVKGLSEKSWPSWLSLLANAKGNKAVVDPKPTPNEELPPCWRGEDTWLNVDKFAREIFVRLNELLEDEEGKISRQLKELDPPLTWGEVLCRFYRYLHDSRGDEMFKDQKMELDHLFYAPGRHYCFECDEPFTVSRYHPHRPICPRCTARRKVASWRAMKSKS